MVGVAKLQLPYWVSRTDEHMNTEDKDTIERATRLRRMMNDWLKSRTPEEREWMLERDLQLVRNQELARRLFQRITDDPLEIKIGLKSYKRNA